MSARKPGEPRKLCDRAGDERIQIPEPIIFEDAGPAADKHTSTVEGAAAYDRQRSAREGDEA